MKKFCINAKLNNQNGLTGAEIVISIIMIILSIGVISMLYINLSFTSRDTDRKTRAVQIATNILENMGQEYFDNIENKLNDNGASDSYGNITTSPIYGTEIPIGYSVNISFTNIDTYKKTANVKVKYRINDREKEISLAKTFYREATDEVNPPVFSGDTYQNQLKTDATDVLSMYDSKSEFAGGIKVICPIMFDKSSNKYKIVTDLETNWYSYTNKLWARILVIPSEELNDYIKDEFVTDLDVLTGDYSYVWIPKYGIKKDSTENIDLFFKYLTTNLAILNNTEYYYVNVNEKIEESTEREYSFESNTGKWCKYTDINSNTSEAYYLNKSQYGPLFEY